MGLAIIFIGMFVHFIFLTRRELLIQHGSFNLILVVSGLLFLVGLSLNFVDGLNHRISSILLVPLVSLGLFRVLRRWFVMRFNREPRDTFFNWESGLFWDRLFNIACGLLPLLLWIMLSSTFNV